MEDDGDLDGDGYIEYRTRNPTSGLDNQCWKDSWNSIVHPDGTLAALPRATCELQGYAYDARLRTAALARTYWHDDALADRLEAEAAQLRSRFNRDFWVDDGFFALALDGEKAQVATKASNMGHLLWSGIVDERHAPQVVQQLLGPELFSGWGVRTVAADHPVYNPVGYHIGTVWPHDTALIALGLRRYGYLKEATALATAILEAARFFGYRLPEAFAGFTRGETTFPVEYPSACSPQAWATGAPLMLLRVLLGLEPTESGLGVDPLLPAGVGRIRLTGVPGRWGAADASADRSGS
jgi:glycogen debranching enzyme